MIRKREFAPLGSFGALLAPKYRFSPSKEPPSLIVRGASSLKDSRERACPHYACRSGFRDYEKSRRERERERVDADKSTGCSGQADSASSKRTGRLDETQGHSTRASMGSFYN